MFKSNSRKHMKRKVGISILIMLIIIQIFVSNYQINELLGADKDQFDEKSTIRSYYATSPYDFFNESKHPRYPLVNRPFGMIHYPHKAYPVIISYNENFTIIVNATSATADWEFTLTNGTFTTSWSPPTTGQYLIRAKWTGDYNYNPLISVPALLEVKAQ